MALYKQTRESVTVYVKADSINSTVDKKTAEETQGEDKKTDSEKNEKSKALFTKKQVLHFTKKALNTALYTMPNFSVSNLGNFTGDSNFQQVAQRKLEIVQDSAKSVSNPAFAGLGAAAIGAGPVGIGVAASVAMLGTAISIAGKYEQRNINEAIKEAKDNSNANYAKSRSGIDLTDGRTRLR
jgi:hypothetical protein